MNGAWECRTLPQEWTGATYPQPWKHAERGNLRPIPLASCQGKLLNLIIPTLFVRHLNNKNWLLFQMIGFREHIATQDALLQLKEDVLNSPSAALNVYGRPSDRHIQSIRKCIAPRWPVGRVGTGS